jgi:hypothetical protein
VPDLPEDLRPRLEGVLAKRKRIAGVVDALRTELDGYIAEHDVPDNDALPHGERPARRFPGMLQLTAPPEEWLSGTPVRQFRTALRAAFRSHDKQTQREAALQRYGLGPSRRPVAVADIARTAGVTVATVNRWIRDCVGHVHASACMPLHPRTRTGDRACFITAHLADQTLGSLDPTDPAICQQIADLITAALPGLDVDAGVRLLLHLAGWHIDLSPAHISALIRSVTDTVRP